MSDSQFTLPFLAILLFVAGGLTVGCQFQEYGPPEVLTTASQAQEATGQEEMHGLPVQLDGVITYVDPKWGALSLRDETGGLFISMAGQEITNHVRSGRLEEGHRPVLAKGGAETIEAYRDAA